jgi:hypothetical protein
MFPARKNCVKSSLVLGIYTILLALNAGSSRAQTTITVPTNYPTIQSAINAANNGDTVLVAPGTYVENINFNGKAVTVTSSNGAGATIIDGNHNGTVVTFNHSETLSSVLSGFTFATAFRAVVSARASPLPRPLPPSPQTWSPAITLRWPLESTWMAVRR